MLSPSPSSPPFPYTTLFRSNFTLAPWDWRYYAEKLRQAKANFDDAAIKPYLVLDHMIEAAFDCASRLFGITFTERDRKSTRLNSSHLGSSYAVFCWKK